MNPIVSIIIPIYNEEKYIENCIISLLNQEYPKEKMEWLFLDGRSTDNTVNIINSYIVEYGSLIRLIDNPNRIQSYAMNIGIKEAKGNYIIRMDAHADYDKDYVKECVKLLDTGLYDNVGGIAETRSKSSFGKIIALMMSSKFGVGNSQFRTSQEARLVDTVPFGAFRKDYLEKIGGFDERLDRNEDNEINYRIRKQGGKVYMSPKIKFTYYCRDTLKGILSMAFQNGKWTIITSKLCPGSMSVRHLVTFDFVMSLIGLTVISCFSTVFCFLLLLELLIYFSTALFFSIKTKSNIDSVMKLLLLFPAFHVAYGCGSLSGIIVVFRRALKI